MEQTVNTFTKGLQKDTNPMIQGTDTLTDALNATIVTMNGNEIILQNDMGNRRVDHAYLPEGYEPVGMKEYGGVIYVASLNPKTKMCQIGSFPSPQKRHQNKSYDKSIDFSDCLSESNDGYIDENKIVQLFPLMSENSIHVGDKFVIVDDTIWKKDKNNNYIYVDKITNFNNTTGTTKVTTPKNKLYTLAIGVLDNTGQFYDITNNLVRYNEYGKIISSFDENTSDIIKFNSGYFIAPSISDDNKIKETINDSSLIETRLAMPANTYSEKFIGPLYLKKTYNCIQNFNYDFQAVRDGGNIKITITGICTYNCPDNAMDGTGGDETYLTYSTGSTTFKFFDVTFKEINNITPTTKTTITYDKVSNLYTATVIKEYSISYDNTPTKLTYDIKVRANSKCNGYIKSLSYLNQTFNTSLLNTTQLIIDGWRFRRLQDDDGNYLNQTELVYNLQKYQTRNVEFKNFTLYFKDVTLSNNNVKILSGLSVNPGINRVILNWDEIGLVERKLYEIRITYNILDLNTGKYLTQDLIPTDLNMFEADTVAKSNNEQQEINPNESVLSDSTSHLDESDDGESNNKPNIIIHPSIPKTNNFEIEDLWILTTALFNDCFDSVRNYCVVEKENNIKVLSEEKIKEKLKNISANIDYDITDIITSTTKEKFSGSPVIFGQFNENDNVEYRCDYTQNYKVYGYCSVKLKNYNQTLYPDFVNAVIDFNGFNQFKNILSTPRLDNNELINNFDDTQDALIKLIANSDNKYPIMIDYTLHYWDKLYGKVNTSKSLKLEKAIVPLETKLFDLFLPKSGKEEFAHPGISYVSYRGSTYNYANGVLVSTEAKDYAPNFITRQSNNIGNLGGAVNEFEYDAVMSNFNSSKLFTYLHPYIIDNDPYYDKIWLNDGTSTDDTNEKSAFDNDNICRIFIKYKTPGTTEYNWALCEFIENDETKYYDSLSLYNSSYVPQILLKLLKYNNNNIYIYTNVNDEINIGYPSNYLATELIDKDFDLKLNINNNQLVIELKDKPDLNHPFINTLSINSDVSDDIKFKIHIKTNPDKLDDLTDQLINNNIYDGVVVLNSIDNDLKRGTLTDKNNNIFSKDNTFYYYNNGLSPLMSKIKIENNYSYIDMSADYIVTQNVHDKYRLKKEDGTILAKVKYLQSISLDNLFTEL